MISVCSVKTLVFTYSWWKLDYQLEIEFCCTLVKNDFLLVCTEIVAMKMLIFRSSSPEMLCKKVVVKNFTQFTGKHQKKFNNKKWNSKEVQGCERNLIKRLVSTLILSRAWGGIFVIHFRYKYPWCVSQTRYCFEYDEKSTKPSKICSYLDSK